MGSARLEHRSQQLTLTLALAGALASASVGFAQQPGLERLPVDQLDVVPPSSRVAGTLGSLKIRDTSCRGLSPARLRRRIVDVVVQEWGFFGFTVVDQTRDEPVDRTARTAQASRGGRRRWSRLSAADTVRVADSIAGYWTVTPEGSWILDNQNQRWIGSGSAARWRTPWSAAFVSWVMCESGLDESAEFRRAVAHHTYIDQAIRARDTGGRQAAFTAYEIGETTILPGDLLCSGRRPSYRTLAERRRQMGEGARTHCDVVVKLDEEHDRILTIGGNVRGTVGLKLMPAVREPGVGLRPEGGARRLFAHLKLRAEPIEPGALDGSPTMRAVVCAAGFQTPEQRAAANLVTASPSASRC